MSMRISNRISEDSFETGDSPFLRVLRVVIGSSRCETIALIVRLKISTVTKFCGGRLSLEAVPRQVRNLVALIYVKSISWFYDSI